VLDSLKEYSFYLLVSIALVGLSNAVESSYLHSFLSNDLVTLLIALLAINTTTSSVVMTKLKEISDQKQDADFSGTTKQLKKSMLEQVAYVFAAIVLSIFAGSELIQGLTTYSFLIIEVLMTAIFVAALAALHDTGKAIFIILDFEK